MYTMLDNREQGIYRNLIDECWVSGTITSDPEILARFVREPIDYFSIVWAKIRRKFHKIGDGSRLFNPRLEEDRRRLMLNAKFNKKRASKAGKARWNKSNAEKSVDASSIVQASFEHAFEQCQTQTHIGNIPSLKDSSNLDTNISPINSPAEKRPGRPRDLAADCFSSKCRELTNVPYVPEGGDFVMLAKLRKAYNVPSRQLPPEWEQACQNYFASPLGQYSLADLANLKRYAVFRNSAVDQFNKPLSHANRSNNGHKTKDARTFAAIRQVSLALDRQDGGGEQRGDRAGDSSRVLPKAKDYQA